MRNLTRLEELFLGLLAFYLFLQLHIAWWLFFALILAPDLSMAGYAIGPRSGALLYNLVHHRAVSASLYIAGGLLGAPWLQAAALILFAHSSFDRVLGYGLKYPDSFQHTHLGMIGHEQRPA
jgi:hypothetical protein